MSDGSRLGDPARLGGYEVLDRLGDGGMGSVFLARSPQGRRVAVKVVRAELSQDEEFRAPAHAIISDEYGPVQWSPAKRDRRRVSRRRAAEHHVQGCGSRRCLSRTYPDQPPAGSDSQVIAFSPSPRQRSWSTRQAAFIGTASKPRAMGSRRC
ncbi:hypothetical protein AB0B94_05005 [Micromonospora sp. NPDC048986]|uniref:hypothetical protein n=1 Tax=Micromonospora sp. NPDC048986 TaxID=3155644 RepID=UPI00340E130F